MAKIHVCVNRKIQNTYLLYTRSGLYGCLKHWEKDYFSDMAKFMTTCLTKKCAAPFCVTYPISIETVVMSTNCFISLFFFVYFCNFSVKLGGISKRKFYAYRTLRFQEIGHFRSKYGMRALFKISHKFCYVCFFKCTNLMISSSVISPLSLSPLSQTSFQNSISKLQMYIQIKWVKWSNNCLCS